jgi:hypothetical protein
MRHAAESTRPSQKCLFLLYLILAAKNIFKFNTPSPFDAGNTKNHDSGRRSHGQRRLNNFYPATTLPMQSTKQEVESEHKPKTMACRRFVDHVPICWRLPKRGSTAFGPEHCRTIGFRLSGQHCHARCDGITAFR